MNDKLKTAFTLIELLVVLAIVGILSGLIIVGMNGMIQKANVAKGQVFSSSLRNTLLANLISEWKFDELTTAVNGTIIQDSWSEGRTGTLSTGDALDKLKNGDNCVFGKCLQFDGTDDYITIAAFPLTGTVISLDAWVKIQNKAATGSTILGDAAQSTTVGFIYTYRGSNNNTLAWQYADGSIAAVGSSSSFFNGYDNTWVLATIVCDYANKTINFYRNGAFVNSVSMSGTPVFPSTSRVRYLGRYSTSHTYALLGYMDDLRIYNAAIPSSQIRQEYYLGLNRLLANGKISNEEYETRIKYEE